jgi:hypothetical protein
MSVKLQSHEAVQGIDMITSSIDGVVDASELLDSSLNQMVDLLCTRDVGFHGEDFRLAIAGYLIDESLCRLEALLIAICQHYLCASFAGERDGCGLADALREVSGFQLMLVVVRTSHRKRHL